MQKTWANIEMWGGDRVKRLCASRTVQIPVQGLCLCQWRRAAPRQQPRPSPRSRWFGTPTTLRRRQAPFPARKHHVGPLRWRRKVLCSIPQRREGRPWRSSLRRNWARRRRLQRPLPWRMRRLCAPTPSHCLHGDLRGRQSRQQHPAALRALPHLPLRCPLSSWCNHGTSRPSNWTRSMFSAAGRTLPWDCFPRRGGPQSSSR